MHGERKEVKCPLPPGLQPIPLAFAQAPGTTLGRGSGTSTRCTMLCSQGIPPQTHTGPDQPHATWLATTTTRHCQPPPPPLATTTTASHYLLLLAATATAVNHHHWPLPTTAGHHCHCWPPLPRLHHRRTAAEPPHTARCFLTEHCTGIAQCTGRCPPHSAARALPHARCQPRGAVSPPGPAVPPYPGRHPEDGLRLLEEIHGVDGAPRPARSERGSFHLPPPPVPLQPRRARPAPAARLPARPPRAPPAWARPQRRVRAAGGTTRRVGEGGTGRCARPARLTAPPAASQSGAPGRRGQAGTP